MKKLHVLFKFAIAIATLSITAPVVFSIMLDNKTDAMLTTLTLKREICELMQQQRIAVKRSLATDSICALSVEYRANNSGNGGVMYVEDRKIHIADNQVVATELVDVKSEIESRVDVMSILLLCLCFLMGTLLWLAIS